MSWKIKDEWIDLAQATHVVIYHNPDTGAEHQLINHFKLTACPHCGTVKDQSTPTDFAKAKDDTLFALQAHHRELMKYRELHPRVRLK